MGNYNMKESDINKIMANCITEKLYKIITSGNFYFENEYKICRLLEHLIKTDNEILFENIFYNIIRFYERRYRIINNQYEWMEKLMHRMEIDYAFMEIMCECYLKKFGIIKLYGKNNYDNITEDNIIYINLNLNTEPLILLKNIIMLSKIGFPYYCIDYIGNDDTDNIDESYNKIINICKNKNINILEDNYYLEKMKKKIIRKKYPFL